MQGTLRVGDIWPARSRLQMGGHFPSPQMNVDIDMFSIWQNNLLIVPIIVGKASGGTSITNQERNSKPIPHPQSNRSG